MNSSSFGYWLVNRQMCRRCPFYARSQDVTARKFVAEVVRLLPTLRPRMILVMYFLQSRVVDLGIDLRGSDARVAEHLLDQPKVRTASK